MKRFIFWLRKKKRIEARKCGQCCLTCSYYQECVADGAKGSSFGMSSILAQYFGGSFFLAGVALILSSFFPLIFWITVGRVANSLGAIAENTEEIARINSERASDKPESIF